MSSIRKPTLAAIERVLDHSRGVPYSYAAVGAFKV
jgi:hypothetical protein